MSAKVVENLTFLGTTYPFDNSYGNTAVAAVDGQAVTATPDFEIDIPTIDVSRLLFLAIWADGDMVVDFNDTGSPEPTISLKANKPYIWRAETGTAGSGYTPCLLTADVTKAYCTAANGTKLYILASFKAIA